MHASTQKGWIVITGCSSGIGLCVANGLKALGYQVLPCCRTALQAQVLAADFPQVVAFDLALEADVDAGAAQILHITEGHIYALFNNAGFGQPGALEDISRATLEAQFAVNVFGLHRLTQRLLPTLIARADARLIQHSSVLGFVGMPFRGAYNASKYAVEGLCDTLRQELKGTGVQVSLIEPGPVLSEFRNNALQVLKANVDLTASRHAMTYQKSLARLAAKGPAVPFTVAPEVVLNCVVHALTHPRAKIRYRVTVPTHVLAVLKRLLSSRWFDALVAASSKA